jgi:radical SAM superfamily enzyme YgiQ (UPF0313 family)
VAFGVTEFERSYPRYHGHVITPYNETDSLVIQVMYACAHGRCTFCGSYVGKAFRLRRLEYIREDISGVDPELKANVTRVFLSDGDVLALPLSRMVDLLDHLAAELPRLQRVSAYATPHSLLPLALDELCEMREHGLGLLYVGLESGDDTTLALAGRGMSATQQIRAFTKAKQAGLAIAVSTLLGLGGKERSAQHARLTGQALTLIDPQYIEVFSLMPEPGTRLAEAIHGGQFTVPDAAGLLRELRVIVGETEVTQAGIRTNHQPSYLEISGTLPEDKAAILHVIDDLLDRGEVPPLRPEDLRAV